MVGAALGMEPGRTESAGNDVELGMSDIIKKGLGMDRKDATR